jgi:hypothetical protein
MSQKPTLAILSDIHYASAAEQARGDDYEFEGVPNPVLRALLKIHRHFVWLRHPLRQNHLLDKFLAQVEPADYVIANGDYSCDSGFVGVSDNAVCQSAKECLVKLRSRFGERFHATFGDHELGKLSLVGARGGMRLASFQRAREELLLAPFWKFELGSYVLIGVTSSLVALPVFEADTLPEERAGWQKLRELHLAEIRSAFTQIKSDQRVLLFCHDPTALPFLWREEAVRSQLPRLEQTIIGHLHSNLILWKSRLLAGMPAIQFLGPSARRMSTALNEAQHWKSFHVRLCPALSGIELLKDGGFLKVTLDLDGRTPARFQFHRISR